MKLSGIKEALNQTDEIRFQLPNGSYVPNHFHVTEVGKIQKHFIDCGGTIRLETVISFQLYTASDYDHRLSAQKLKSIIELSEEKLELGNHEIEVEYQAETIGKYGLEFNGKDFVLTTKQTDCLAKDNCGIPATKEKKVLSSLTVDASACCGPDSNCC